MESRILRGLVTLGVPGVALGIFYLLLRSFGFSFSAIGSEASAFIAILFLLIVGGITFYALHKWAPEQRLRESHQPNTRPLTPSPIESSFDLVREHESGELTEETSKESEDVLKQQLRQHQDRLRSLRKREATYSSDAVPKDLIKNIEREQQEVDNLNKVLAICRKIKELEEDPLQTINGELRNIDRTIVTLRQKIEEIYEHKHKVVVDLHARIDLLATRWNRVKQQIDDVMEKRRAELSENFSPVRTAMSALLAGTTTARNMQPLIDEVKMAHRAFEAEVKTLEQWIKDELADVKKAKLELEEDITTVEFCEDALFALESGESIVGAVKAVYSDAEGVLFLTNNRLIFEQNEFISEERLLGFIPKGAKKLVHKPLLEKRLHEIRVVRAYKDNKIPFFYKDYLYFEFEGAEELSANVLLSEQDCDTWAHKIQKCANT